MENRLQDDTPINTNIPTAIIAERKDSDSIDLENDDQEKIAKKGENISTISPIKFPLTRKEIGDGSTEWIDMLNKDEKSVNININSANKYDTISEKQSGKSINLLDKSTTSSYYTVSKAPNITCKLHGQAFIGVDTFKFKLVCKKCGESGAKETYLEFLESNTEFIPDEEDNFECADHPDTKGVFYCDDCKCFICKVCFANNHRQHSSNLPNAIAAKFRDNMYAIMNEMCQIKPRLEDSLQEMTKANLDLRAIREASIRRVKDIVIKISSVSKAKFEKINSSFIKIFDEVDAEVENVYNRLVGLSKKVMKCESELQEVSNSINNKYSDYWVMCAFKKSKSKLFLEVHNAIEDSKNFVNFKIGNVKQKAADKMELFNKEINSSYKQVAILEKSVETSVKSGITNNSFSLRRFIKYHRKGLKYYKTSSLKLKVNKGIFLAGLGLCGLYLSSREDNSKKSIPIQIKLSEIKEQEMEQKLSENHNLISVVNRIDPVYSIYFGKVIYLKPDVTYMLSVSNMDSNSYIDIWCGEVPKVYLSSMVQDLSCNCTGIYFNFSTAEGMESDFNEFNLGIISSLIYSNLE